ncbi:NIPA-like protein 2 [Glugoides intestinalis]
MLRLLFLFSTVLGFVCILDADCRAGGLFNIDDKFCVNNRCTALKPAFSPCKNPRDCASFSYYGPLACTGACGSKSECNNPFFEKTTYCCKPVPLKGKCNPNRPKPLNGCDKTHFCLTENGVSRCSEKPENTWALGTLLSLGGNLFINLGINFQKKSYTAKTIMLLTYNVHSMELGILIYILGKIASFSAYIFCNQSLLAGLSASGLVANSILAPLINQEVFTWNDGVAIFLVIAGTMIIINNTSRTHTTYTICELITMLKQPHNILWILFILSCILILFFIIKFVEINSSWNLVNDRFQFFKSETIHFEENGIVMKYIMVFLYVFLSSFIASFTTLSIKILGQIFDRYFHEQGPIFSFTTLFFSFTLVICTFFQIYWLNRALKHYDALVAIPIFQMSWTVLSILTAGIYFQDFETYSKEQLKRFVFGVFVIFCGSIFLAMKIKNKNTIRSRRVDDNEELKSR